MILLNNYKLLDSSETWFQQTQLSIILNQVMMMVMIMMIMIMMIIIIIITFRKYVSDIPGNHDVKELQKTAILGAAHILRKVLT